MDEKRPIALSCLVGEERYEHEKEYHDPSEAQQNPAPQPLESKDTHYPCYTATVKAISKIRSIRITNHPTTPPMPQMAIVSGLMGRGGESTRFVSSRSITPITPLTRRMGTDSSNSTSTATAHITTNASTVHSMNGCYTRNHRSVVHSLKGSDLLLWDLGLINLSHARGFCMLSSRDLSRHVNHTSQK